MNTGVIHDLNNLGLGDLLGKDTRQTSTFMVNFQSDLGSLLSGLMKEPLKHLHHKVERRVVVVVQEHSKTRRFFELGPPFFYCYPCSVAGFLLVAHPEERE